MDRAAETKFRGWLCCERPATDLLSRISGETDIIFARFPIVVQHCSVPSSLLTPTSGKPAQNLLSCRSGSQVGTVARCELPLLGENPCLYHRSEAVFRRQRSQCTDGTLLKRRLAFLKQANKGRGFRGHKLLILHSCDKVNRVWA